jgi:hypothetical protein
MWDTLGSLIGSFLDIVGYASHLIIVIFRNLLLLGIIVGALYGIFKLGQHGFRQLRGLRGGQQETSDTAPKDKLEDGRE